MRCKLYIFMSALILVLSTYSYGFPEKMQRNKKNQEDNIQKILNHMQLRHEICKLQVSIYKSEAEASAKNLAAQYKKLSELREQECVQMAKTIDKLSKIEKKRKSKQIKDKKSEHSPQVKHNKFHPRHSPAHAKKHRAFKPHHPKHVAQNDKVHTA